jgi:nucleoside-diphosphate-sugar epimerase
VNCLVTGATGFIGTALCEALRHRGDDVRAYSRSGGALQDGTPTTAVDLQQSRLGLADLRGVDVVYHLAGVAHQHAEDALYEQVNVQATLALADACLCAGVSHFVFLSSVKAMGAATTPSPREEADCAVPDDAYGRSKRAAEDGLLDLCRGRMALTIIRPALVYGPDARGNLALLDRWARQGLPRPPPGGQRSMISRTDLVALLCTVADRQGIAPQVWIATDGESYSSRRVYDTLRQVHGLAPGRAWWPRWLWRAGTAVLDRVRPGGAPHWNKVFGTELYSNRAVMRDTSWQPRLTLADALGAKGPGG